MHEPARFQRLLAKIDQRGQAVAALVQVEQTLLHIFWFNLAGSFGFQDELIIAAFNNEILPTFGDHDAVISNRDFDFSLPG